MFKILTLNNISVRGLERMPRDKYEIASEIQHPDAVLLRSYKMHGMVIPDSLKAVGRAGAGVNNIPVEALSKRGIPVFNSPGANANAVCELVIGGMFLACRNICQAWDFARQVVGDDAAIGKQVEAGKKQFVGYELPGRVLGVIGLGAIGVQVANTALKLGMRVYGYDPKITVQSAWRMSSDVQQATSIDDLLSKVDFVTFHVPLMDSTKCMLNAERLGLMKKGAVILNFAREGIVDDAAVLDAIKSGKVFAYINDFPSNLLKTSDRVITLPHLGASTAEAEDNCAVMVVDQVRDFLENGNIRNAVNFPEAVMPRTEGFRIAIANSNVPNMVGQISTAMARAGLNILDLLNKSLGDLAYTVADVDKRLPASVVHEIAAIDGVLSVRVINV
ncbi:MAG: D-3-phosphoglycerate dehydrogenase [Gammaproteobacteria bacterium]|nr:MAG: D-3-phosphoglycerate dehydrogenase [Gammaproteobacteria bacterium]TND07052.1 MAG: D-3-phosphoglycerate dehydrogenase [Gammaproteobacteria bacterium]